MTTDTKIPTPDHFWGYDDDRKAHNEEKAQDVGLESCTHCGRGVQPGRGFLVVVIDGGASVVHPDSDADDADPGYMGAWLLGSTCAKGVPAAFRKAV
jgi:hypothetical protein